MAKKDPTELSVEEKLKTLYQLQTTLSAIDEKRALRGELPLEVQDLEDEIEGLHIRVEKIQHEIAEFQDAVAQKQNEIEQAQASVDRYKMQLDDVKNNREYDTLTKEIEFQSLEIELCNKKIREALAKVEDKKRELQHTNELIDDRQTALSEKKNELDEIMLETREEEDKLKSRARILKQRLSRVCSPASSAYARAPATVWALCMCITMLAVAALTRYRHSVSSTSRCTRRLSCANIADVS